MTMDYEEEKKKSESKSFRFFHQKCPFPSSGKHARTIVELRRSIREEVEVSRWERKEWRK